MATSDLPIEIRRRIRQELRQIVAPPNSRLRMEQLEKLGIDPDSLVTKAAAPAPVVVEEASVVEEVEEVEEESEEEESEDGIN